jgi:hypothetical protein
MIFIAIPAENVHAMPFNAPVNYPVATDPSFVAVGDFNKDGKPDLAVACYSSNNVSILLGKGDGTFTMAAGSPILVGINPFSIAVGDFNKDGKPDLAVACLSSNNVSILLGNGDGTFTAAASPVVGSNPVSVAVGDFNKDGNLDLAVTSFSGPPHTNIAVLIGNGDGTFAAPVNYGTDEAHPSCVAVGDFNMDGNPDLTVTDENNSNVSILIGDGHGHFAAPVYYATGQSPSSVAVGDFNIDGKPDLAVANYDDNNVSILLGKGDGTFTSAAGGPIAVGNSPTCIVAGDFNLDGKPDLAVSSRDSTNISILLGDGHGGFTGAVNYTIVNWPNCVAVGDFNLDGDPDLATANWSGNKVCILLNTPEPPTVTAVNPASGLQGQSLQAIITGTKFAGPTTISFGTGITVNSIKVNSLTQITANISLATDAAAGARNVSVTTPGGTATLTGGFTVNAALINTGPPTSRGSSVAGSGSANMQQGPVSLPTVSVRSASLSVGKVSPGTPVTVTANVANSGAVNGAARITLYVNGQEESSQGITVNSGNSTLVTFTVSRNEPGTYSVYVGGTQAGSFTVDEFAGPGPIAIGVGLLFIFIFAAVIIVYRSQRSRQRA